MNWKKIALGSTLAGTLVLAGLSGQAVAYWGCSAPGQTTVSPAGQSKLDEIRQKYDADLTTLEARLRATSRDLDQAMVDRDPAKAKELRQALYDLEQEYYPLRDQVGDELAGAGGAGNWGRGGWSCRWHASHDGTSGGGALASRWDGHRGGCCW